MFQPGAVRHEVGRDLVQLIPLGELVAPGQLVTAPPCVRPSVVFPLRSTLVLHRLSLPPALQALGVGMMAVGIWLYVTNNEFAVISRGQFLVGSVLMMAGGFGVIILGFLGAVGAIFESAFVLIVVSVM